MPTQEQQLVIQQAYEKIQILKQSVQLVENQLNETSLGLDDMKLKIQHQTDTFKDSLKRALELDKECRDVLNDMENEDLKVVDHTFEKSSQEHNVQQIIRIYVGRPILYKEELKRELLELNKDIEETKLHRVQVYIDGLNRYLLDDDILKHLAVWCEISHNQSKIIQISTKLKLDLEESEYQYDLLINRVDERRQQLEEVQEGLEDINKNRKKSK